MIINSCLGSKSGIRYDGDDIKPNPFLDSLLNQHKARQALNTAALQAQHVPDESEEEDTMEEVSITTSTQSSHRVLARESEEDVQEEETWIPSLQLHHLDQQDCEEMRRLWKKQRKHQTVPECSLRTQMDDDTEAESQPLIRWTKCY